MINKDPIYELIEDFLQGNLSEQDEEKVVTRMKQDPLFEKELEESAYINHVIEGAGVDMLREKMTRDIQRMDQQNLLKKKIITTLLVVSFLAGLIWSYFSLNQREKVHFQSGSSTVLTEENEMDIPGLSQDSGIVTYLHSNEFTSDNKPESKSDSKIAYSTKEIKESKLTPNENILVGRINNDSIISLSDDISAEEQEKIMHEPIMYSKKPAIIPEPEPVKCEIDFDVDIQPSCYDKHTGAIEITFEKLDSDPSIYQYSLNDDMKRNSTGSFKELSSGTYTISIADKQGCEGIKDVFVPLKPCSREVRAYSFAPEFGEYWEISSQNSKEGIYNIVNRSGQVIKKGVCNPQGIDQWDGTDSKGILVPQGLYICLFSFDDGSVEKVEVTVIR